MFLNVRIAKMNLIKFINAEYFVNKGNCTAKKKTFSLQFYFRIAMNLAMLDGSFPFFWNVSICSSHIKSLQSVAYPPPQ